MTVHCPHCSTGYLLPDHLVGPKGARVSCPECRGEFAVWREHADGGGNSHVGVEPPAESAPDPTPAPVCHDIQAEPTESAAVAIAASVLDALEETLGGGALRDASRRGRAFAEHGPAILDAFEEFRRRAGEHAPAVCFRSALRERSGIHLEARSPG